jgi:hypothetical protein
MKLWLVCKGELRQIWSGTEADAEKWRKLGFTVEEA